MNTFVSFLITAWLTVTSHAATRLAVLEVGVRRGTVHRSTSPTSPYTTVSGVASLLKALHPDRRQRRASPLQSGLSVVPDLFQRADSGLLVAVSGAAVDWHQLPRTATFLEENESDGTLVGHLQTPGKRHDALLTQVGVAASSETVQRLQQVPLTSTTATEEDSQTKKNELSAVKIALDDAAAASDFDTSLTSFIAHADEQARAQGKTVLLYLLIQDNQNDQDVVTAMAQQQRRRLEEVEGGEANNQEQDAEQQQGNGADNGGFYGYGYFNDYGEWVTPYKSMFQIQYFNVVLWTSIGLTIVLLTTIYFMMFMPLEPDTLLFGESAKMVGDD